MTKQFVAILAILAVAASAHAVSLGTDITIFDNDVLGTDTGFNAWNQGDTPGEDGEIEPGSSWDQKWDLENMFVGGTTLTLVGGYDFQNGVSANGRTYTGGHVFIDVGRGDSAVYGSSVPSSVQTSNGYNYRSYDFGYEYALVMDGNQFHVYDADGLMSFQTAYFEINEESNPWRLDLRNLDASDILATGDLTYYDTAAFAALDDGDNVLGAGGYQYAMQFDLSGLGLSDDLLGAGNIFHYTYGCGNDAMMGQIQAVPDGGATLALLGCAIFALEGLRRKVLR